MGNPLEEMRALLMSGRPEDAERRLLALAPRDRAPRLLLARLANEQGHWWLAEKLALKVSGNRQQHLLNFSTRLFGDDLRDASRRSFGHFDVLHGCLCVSAHGRHLAFGFQA